MPFPSITYLDQLIGTVRDEFLHLYAQIEGWLRKEHKDDGSHGDISADSVTTDGTVTATGETHTFGPITITTGTGGGQITISDTWRIQRGVASSPLSEDWALEVFDLAENTSLPVYELGYYSPSTTYLLIPRATSLALGFKDGAAADRLKYVAVQDGVYETGRTVAMGYWTTWTPTWTNLTVGDGTVSARYTDVGDTTFFELTLVFGTTTSVSGIITFSLPHDAETNIGEVLIVGHGTAFDTNVAQVSNLAAQLVTATTARVFYASFPWQNTSATVPFTWVTTDQLYLKGFFRRG